MIINEQIIVHKHGSMWAVGILHHNKQNIIDRYNSFWNHKLTSGELYWLQEEYEPYFAFLWAKRTVFLKRLSNVFLYYLLNQAEAEEKTTGQHVFRGQCGGAMPLAKKMSEKYIQGLTFENFLRNSSQTVNNTVWFGLSRYLAKT